MSFGIAGIGANPASFRPSFSGVTSTNIGAMFPRARTLIDPSISSNFRYLPMRTYYKSAQPANQVTKDGNSRLMKKSAFLENFGQRSLIAHAKRSFSMTTPWRAYWTPNQNKERNVSQQMEQRIAEAQETMEGYLPDYVRAHLRNVYGTLCGSILVAGVGATVSTSSGMVVSPVVSLVGGLGLILGISFTPQQYHWARMGMLTGFCYLTGGMLAPILAKLAIVSPGTIVSSLIGTSAIFAGFTSAALFAKKDTFLKMGGPLMGGLLGLIGIQLAGMLFPSFGLMTFNLVTIGSMGLFSLLTAYDTQNMIARAKEGETDVIGDCLNLFLDVYNIFVSLLRWGGMGSEE